MKKNILLTTILIFSAAMQIMAQCTPDVSITAPLVPDSATNLPHAVAGTSYSTIIYLKVPATAVYLGQTATIDSIQITSVSGLPTIGGVPNFTYVCNTSNCAWPGGAYGCILLTGTPTVAQQNTTHPLTVNIMAYGKYFGSSIQVPQTADDYKIVIDQAAGISDVNSTKFSVGQNIPNPFSNETSIEYNVAKNSMVSFKLFNMLGKEIYSTQIRSEAGKNKFSFKPADMDPGIYMYSIGSGANTIVKRMILTN